MPMRYSTPLLDLFYDPRNHDYLIQNYCEHQEYGYSVATGPLVLVEEDAMRTRGLEIVLSHLKAYPDRVDLLGKDCFGATPHKRRKLFRTHPRITIVHHCKGDQLGLTPMRFIRGSNFDSDVEHRVILQLPTIQIVFDEALMRTMEAAKRLLPPVTKQP